MIAASAGVLTVLAVYLLALEILKDRSYALFAAFILTLSPTHIHFSRVAYSNVLGGLFSVFAVLFYLRWLKKFRIGNILLALFFFLLSIFSYQTYRIFLPIVFVLTPLVLWRDLKKNDCLKILASTFLFLGIVGLSFVSPQSRRRVQETSALFNRPAIVEQINEDGIAGTSVFVARLFHNKVASAAFGFLGRYFSYFDPRFLFVEVSGETQRHATPGIGFLYLVDAFFVLVGTDRKSVV